MQIINDNLAMTVSTVTPRYNAVVRRHLLGPPYKRGALWDPVDLFDIVIPSQRTRVPNQRPTESDSQAKLPRLEVELGAIQVLRNAFFLEI